jgi:1,5-anhydro-D-fructose reductase (1,5-anhydro-D-mannitol-forming)
MVAKREIEAMTIGWALLGTGRHAERSVVEQLKSAADGELVAVMSRERARGEAFARKHGIAKVHSSFQDVLRDPDVQALYDATPDGLHAQHAIEAAQAGKHSLLEKPLAISVEDCEKAIEACRRHGVKLGVVFNQRHEAIHQEARRIVLAGEIGDVMLAHVQIPLRTAPSVPTPSPPTWRTDRTMRSGGILMSIGDHAFDTLSYLVGQDIDEVSAFTDATGTDIRNERVAGMMLKLSKGAIGYAAVTSKTPFARRPFDIHGTKGSLIIENSYVYLTGAGEDPAPTLTIVSDGGSTVRSFAATDCFRLEVEQFNRAVEGKGEPMTSPQDGLRALVITDALYAAVRSGRVVKIPQLTPQQR